MIASTTLQSKILRTRKRLSENIWLPKISAIALISLLVLLSLVIRATYISSRYGVVETEIPALRIGIADPDNTAYKEEPRTTISEQTPTIILTTDRFYFGDLESFTTGLANVRNKFFVPHELGAPNLQSLSTNLTKWLQHRESQGVHLQNGILILLPDKNIPMPIVIQTMKYLESLSQFSKVILASGLL